MMYYEQIIKLFPDWFLVLISACLIMIMVALFVATVDTVVSWFKDDKKWY